MPISYTTAWLYIAWKPCIIFFVCPNYQTKCQTRLGAIMHLEYSISYHRVINILYNGIIMRNDAEKTDTCRSPNSDNLQHYSKLKQMEKLWFSSLFKYDKQIKYFINSYILIFNMDAHNLTILLLQKALDWYHPFILDSPCDKMLLN